MNADTRRSHDCFSRVVIKRIKIWASLSFPRIISPLDRKCKRAHSILKCTALQEIYSLFVEAFVYLQQPTNLPHNNNNGKVESARAVGPSRAGLRAFEKKGRERERGKERRENVEGTIAQGWFWVKKRENRHPKQGGVREIGDKERE